jgi:hypothetical protein
MRGDAILLGRQGKAGSANMLIRNSGAKNANLGSPGHQQPLVPSASSEIGEPGALRSPGASDRNL